MPVHKRIVTIGGGTGSFTLLSGLRDYPFEISAIVSMADDGGSTGRLRDELGVLPPGDVRQCLVALSEESKKLRQLFNYRFETGDLAGHTVGNILLSALEKMEGNFSKGLDLAMKILRIKGRVIPVTNNNVNLFLKMKNGKVLKGENEINHNFEISKTGIEKIYLKPSAKANPLAIKAIREADVVVIGPGNHYCSIIPNLLVEGISKEICHTKAKVVYIVNLVNKKGHTDNFDLDQYVQSINSFLGKERIDFVVYNNQRPSSSLVEKYRKRGETLVQFNPAKKVERNYAIIKGRLLGKLSVQNPADKISYVRSLIRHNSQKMAKIIRYISEMGEYEKTISEIIPPSSKK